MEIIKGIFIFVGIIACLYVGIMILSKSTVIQKKLTRQINEQTDSVRKMNKELDSTLDSLNKVNPPLQKAMGYVRKFNSKFF